MTAIRGWAYTLCIASVLLGVLQGILPVKNLSSVIKLVLSLYILLLLMAPAQSYAQQGFQLSWDLNLQDETQSIDLTQAIARQTESILQQNILQQMTQAGVPPQSVSVYGQIESGEFFVNKVVLRFFGQPQTQTVEDLLAECLGSVPEYEIIVTDGIEK